MAVVGPNIDKWKGLIKERGNFADYYLFVSRGNEQVLEQLVESQPLAKAIGDSDFEEIGQSLVEFLNSRKKDSITRRSQEAQ